jgi:hypothetical protein
LASSEDDYEITFVEKHNFTDGKGDVHLVGELRNDSDTSLNISLVTGIYDEANNALDADTLSLALYALAPGGSLANDYDGWQSLNGNQGLLAQADCYSVQWDPNWTRESSTKPITTSDDKLKYNNLLQEMIFTGQIVNNKDQAVSSAVVIIMLREMETGRLIASGNVRSFESIPAEESTKYKINLAIEAGLKLDLIASSTISSYKFQIMDIDIIANCELQMKANPMIYDNHEYL